MPTDHRVEDQLADYGSWLEGHLRTSLRPEVAVGPAPTGHDGDRSGHWYATLAATAAVVAAMIAGLVYLSARDADDTKSTRVGFTDRSFQWAEATSHPSMADQQPTSLAGGPVGYVAIRTVARGGAAWFSQDGTVWNDITSEFGGGEILSATATDDALWVLASVAKDTDPSTPAHLYRSADGTAWTEIVPLAHVNAPLHAVGNLLVADVTNAETGEVRTSVSTDGQQWRPPNGFTGHAAVISAASIGPRDFLLTDSGLWTRRDGQMWRLLDRPVGTVIVAADDTLVSIQDLSIPACAGPDIMSIETIDGPPTDDCQHSPGVQVLGADDRWRAVDAGPRLVGVENSPTVGLEGLLVSANIDYQRNLRLTVSQDAGATWRDQGLRRGTSIPASPVTPLLATNGHNVVVLLPSVEGVPTGVVVGTLSADQPQPAPPSTPVPTPGDSSISNATTTPSGTDFVEATLPPDPSNPLSSYLEFPSDHVSAGARMQGWWVVVNNSDTPYLPPNSLDGCAMSWVVYLTNEHTTQEFAMSANCREPITFPPGETRLRVEIVAQTQSCFTDLTASAASGCGGGEPLPMPPGTYRVRLTGGDPIPRPEPLTIEVVGQA